MKYLTQQGIKVRLRQTEITQVRMIIDNFLHAIYRITLCFKRWHQAMKLEVCNFQLLAVKKIVRPGTNRTHVQKWSGGGGGGNLAK